MTALPLAFGLVHWLLLALAVIVLNTIPAFMPPTWALLAWAHIHEGVGVVPLALLGAAGATTGRAILALASRVFGDHLVPRPWRQNITTLVDTLRSHKSLGIPAMVLFGLGPVPSNQVFVAAGIAHAPLPPLLLIFGVTRFASYIIWVTLANSAVSSIGTLLRPQLGSWAAIAAEVIGFGLLILVMRIDWAKHLHRLVPQAPGPMNHEGSTP